MNVTLVRLINWRAPALLVSLLAPALAAADCDTSRDDFGEYLSICHFGVEGKPPTRQLEVKFLADTARYVLELPDVTIDKFKYYFSGSAVEVDIDIRNDGQVGNASTTFAATIEIWNPANDLRYSTVDVTAQVPAIAAGMTARILLTTFALPNSTSDFDVFIAGLVDPPTAAQPVRGSVWEADETNNAKMHVCRVFGPDPVLDPPPPPVCD
jgi:hypothetical protein